MILVLAYMHSKFKHPGKFKVKPATETEVAACSETAGCDGTEIHVESFFVYETALLKIPYETTRDTGPGKEVEHTILTSEGNHSEIAAEIEFHSGKAASSGQDTVCVGT